ncbi:glycoside hydrolase family 36 protein [uncultured Sunxiuqinia sp.]|uniref:glycoside hydrolase family 36 protein n=1 Tax=uncultured Sunxiuqinia sp. TaxID=1573825 RepID=UPI002AA891FB|nr:glycoside hydrolase family 36 protein [uncultured Sunxiuqinia sp.]
MTKKAIERRNFLKLLGTGIGSLLTLPYYANAFEHPAAIDRDRFKIDKPQWILHNDGTFDLVAGRISLQNCRPTIDGQSIFVRNTFMGDSPKGKRIIYELDRGFVMLDLKVNSGSISIGAELSGMPRAPYWFCPLGEATINGVEHFFKQGQGFGGPTGLYEFQKPSQEEFGNELGEQAWSYDSYLTTGLISAENDTIVVGTFEHNDFVQKSTLYNRPHRRGIVDRYPDVESIFFETGFVTERIPLKDDFIKLPDIYIYYGNKPYETLQHLAWNISENMDARKDSKTSYHWDSFNEFQHDFDHEKLTKLLTSLESIDPEILLDTILINDGYAIHGDWLDTNDKWPKGLEPAARDIFQRRYRAGIWVAPFMVSEESKVFKRHKDWLIRDKEGIPIPEWNFKEGKHYALDGSHPEVKRYIQKVFRTFRKMGFTFYKTEFMDWGHKPSVGIQRYDKTKTSVQIFTEILNIIREEIGAGSFWLSGTSPYAPMIGYVDAMRIANSINCEWEQNGVGNMLQESYNCQYFNNVFWQNDPDVISLRNINCNLTDTEKTSLAHWNGILGGVVSISDRFSSLTDEQLETWRLLLPHERPQSATLPYWGQNKTCKVALRRYRSPKAWGLLIFNDTEETVTENFVFSEINEESSNWVYEWTLGESMGLGNLNEITVTLQKHESKLFYLSDGNDSPSEDLSISGIRLKKAYRKQDT